MRNAWLLLILWMLVSCGNSKHIQITLPGITSAELTVTSLETSRVLLHKNIKGSEVELGRLEIGAGLEILELKVHHVHYQNQDSNQFVFEQDEYFSAIIPSNYEAGQLNINSLTTLAACRFQNSISSEKNINEQVDYENELIQDQFIVDQLHGFSPNMDFENMNVLDHASIYGILLGGMEELAKNHGTKISTLTKYLCEDLIHDGKLNGIDAKGFIEERLANYDEQVLKAKLAIALHDFGQKNIKSFSKLPIHALANQISLSLVQVLFPSTIVNYSFDQ